MAQEDPLQSRVRALMSHWATEVVVALLIIVSVGLVIAEAGLASTHPWFDALVWTNHAITGIFIVELSLRFYGERRKKNFVRRYWYDIIAVLPLFRAARFLRVFRLLRVFRFGVIAIRRLSRVSRLFRVVRTEYVIIAFVTLTMVLMGGLSMRYADPAFESLAEALWFSTMTVIAGEPIGPQATSPLGRVVTVVIMLGGLTLFAVITGTVSAVMVDTFRNMKVRPMELEDLQDHVVVCGWNPAGRLIVEELLHDDDRFEHVVLITEEEDLDEHPVVQSNPTRVFTIHGDFTRLDVLEKAGIKQASYALLLADTTNEERSGQDRDARTVLAAMLIEKINPGIYTTVQLLNRDNQTSLRQIGVEEIIVSDEYVGNIMATVTRNRGIVSMLDELLTAKWGHQFYKNAVPPELVGLEVGEAMLRLKQDYDATLLGVDLHDENRRQSVLVNPPTDLTLKQGHDLFVTASEPLDSGDR